MFLLSLSRCSSFLSAPHRSVALMFLHSLVRLSPALQAQTAHFRITVLRWLQEASPQAPRCR